MLKRLLLPIIFAILAYGFWISPNVKEIAAGVAIFLFGMLFLEEGFRAFTGGFLERLLKRTTNRLWKAVAFGIVSTTIMQSSSLVSIITISFLSAGLIWLSSGIGIIFGANIGTTTGAWLVAGFGLKVNIAAYAMPMLTFGIILVFQSSKSLKGIGYILSGLGFLFLGIHHMKEGFEAFRETIDLAEYAIPGFLGLVIFTLIGMAATVIMQSSHATLVLIITALAAGQITYENALALAIGANIGTTITAIIGSMSANYQGKRLAAAHLIFNGATGAIAIIFISQIVWMVDEVAVRVGIADDDYSLKLAVFHTIFNTIGVAVMLPLVPKLVSFLQRTIPKPREELAEPKYINVSAFDFPETLLEAVRQETVHLYDNAFEVMAHGLNLRRTIILSDTDLDAYTANNRDLMEFDLDRTYKNKVKALHAAILEFISKAQTQLPPDFASRLFELREASLGVITSVKEIKHLRKNISTYIRSDNEDIRREYNKLRAQIAGVMREIELLEKSPEEDRDIFALDEFKVAIDEENVIATGVMDTLIREEKITAAMATSLMNDLGYARNAIWQLADVAQALFGTKDALAKEAEDMIALTQDDIDDMRTDEELEA
ncbi:Na/Pi cotransporter family protein [Pseudomonadota bacterium]